MISNQVLQSTLDGLKLISRVDMCIIDSEGLVAASTFENAENFCEPAVSIVPLMLKLSPVVLTETFAPSVVSKVRYE